MDKPFSNIQKLQENIFFCVLTYARFIFEYLNYFSSFSLSRGLYYKHITDP